MIYFIQEANVKRDGIFRSIWVAVFILTAGLVLVPALRASGAGSSPADNSTAEAPEMLTQEEWAGFRAAHESMVDETLKAYDEENYEAFIKNFSGHRRKITERAFTALWCEDYKEKYGDYISKEFFPEKSNPNKTYPLLTYKARFSKNEEIGVRCVFAKDEDGEYRIFYIRFDPYKDLFY